MLSGQPARPAPLPGAPHMFPFRSSRPAYGSPLLDRLPVGISVYQLSNARDASSLTLVYSNAASARLTGLDVRQELGRRLVDIISGDAALAMAETYAEAARTETTVDLGEVTYGDARITERRYRIEAVGLPGRAVAVVFEDVSDRAEASRLRAGNAELARDEARYRTLVEATAAIVWTTSREGHFTTDQPGWRAFTGQSTEALLGEGWAAAIHPDDRARTVAVWAEAVRTGSPYVITHRVRRHDGEYRAMNVRATLLRDAAGDISEWVGVHTDVEDHNAAAVALAASESRSQAIFDGLPDPVLLYALGTDGPGPFQFVNQAAVSLYGYTADELAAMTVEDLLVPGSLGMSDALDSLRKTRQATFDSLHQTRDGRAVPVQTSARLVELDGQLCVLALARDDSERRAFQRTLSRANLGLERTVDERTAALQTFADALRTVQSITARPFATETARTEAYLTAGCEMLGMPIGIASATPLDPATGERLYRIEAVVSPDPSIEPGLTIALRESFCDAVVERGETVVYADAATDQALACHPAYATRGLRAFLGTPVRVDGEIVGTLNFVSPEPRPAGFQPFERDLVEIMADAVARRLVADRAEQQRRHTEDYYRAVVETIEDGIVTLDADCRVTMSNPSARLLLGLQPEARHDDEARRQHLDTDSGGALVPAASGTERGGETCDMDARWPVIGEDRQPVLPDDLPERRVLATGEAVRGAVQGIVHPSGSVRWYRVNAAPIDHDGDGTPEAVVLSYTDITDYRADLHA